MAKLHVILIKSANDFSEILFSTFDLKLFKIRKSQYVEKYSKNQIVCKHPECIEYDTPSIYRCSIGYSVVNNKLSIGDISIRVDIQNIGNEIKDSIRIRHDSENKVFNVFIPACNSNLAFDKIIDLLNNSLSKFICKRLNIINNG